MILSIIIVNWNSWHYLSKCVNSILNKLTLVDYEIIIIDNNSNKDFYTDLSTVDDRIKIIYLKENIGYPKANNIGIEKAKGTYILLLNPDTEIKNDSIESAIMILENNSLIGCLGVKTLKADGSILNTCARKFPNIRSLIYSMLLFHKLFKKCKYFATPNMDYWNHNESCIIDMVHGGFMLIPNKVFIECGKLDTTIDMFYEDIEFPARIRKYGYYTYYLSSSSIMHYTGESSKKAPKSWINKLRYEAWYLYFLNFRCKLIANFYMLSIILIFPLRIFLLFTIYLLMLKSKNKYNIKNELYSILNSLSWSLNKIIRNKKI